MMISKSISLLVFASLLCLVAAASPKVWNFHSFFQGEWTVQVSKTMAKGSESTPHETTLARFSIKEAGPNKLDGIYYENTTDASEIKNLMRVEVLFNADSLSSGVFQMGRSKSSSLFPSPSSSSLSSDEISSIPTKPAFDFDFVERTTSMFVSQGQWHGKALGSYVFSAISANIFTLSVTIVHQDGEIEIHTYTASKSSNQSFIQRHGVIIALAIAMFGFKAFQLKSKNDQRRQIMQQRKANLRAAGGATAVAAAAKTE